MDCVDLTCQVSSFENAVSRHNHPAGCSFCCVAHAHCAANSRRPNGQLPVALPVGSPVSSAAFSSSNTCCCTSQCTACSMTTAQGRKDSKTSRALQRLWPVLPLCCAVAVGQAANTGVNTWPCLTHKHKAVHCHQSSVLRPGKVTWKSYATHQEQLRHAYTPQAVHLPVLRGTT